MRQGFIMRPGCIQPHIEMVREILQKLQIRVHIAKHSVRTVFPHRCLLDTDRIGNISRKHGTSMAESADISLVIYCNHRRSNKIDMMDAAGYMKYNELGYINAQIPWPVIANGGGAGMTLPDTDYHGYEHLPYSPAGKMSGRKHPEPAPAT